ncbi:MAG: hypothetical protein WC686_00125 [Candidatus Shapirobacteria bacterium]|jgi:hypothetical protein
MKENSNHFYVVLGALSLFAVALFQGAQFWSDRLDAEVLGLSWQSILSRFSTNTMPETPRNGGAGKKFPTDTVNEQGWKWDGQTQETGWTMPSGGKINGISKGMPCETAKKFFDFMCSGDEADPTPIGMGTQFSQGEGNKYGMGLNCETFTKVLEDQAYCADGYITKEEIKEIIKSNIPAMPTGMALPTGGIKPFIKTTPKPTAPWQL